MVLMDVLDIVLGGILGYVIVAILPFANVSFRKKNPSKKV